MHFQAWDFLSKELHSDGHEQAAVISITAGGVYNQEYHQEDEYDDANHAAFGHAAPAHFDQREIWESQEDLTENISNIITVASYTFLLAWWGGVGGATYLAVLQRWS